MARIGIDYTSAARQQAGIGRYTRELVTTLLRMESVHQYVIFAATGGLDETRWTAETERLRTAGAKQSAASLKFRTLPISDDWIARLWQRLRLPAPVEMVTGGVDIFYSPDFVLPPTCRKTRTLLTIHDLSFRYFPEAFVPSLRVYLKRVVPRSIARADLVLADSAHTRSDIISLFGAAPDKIQVLYGGVDHRFNPNPEPGERERLQSRYGIGVRPYVLSVGTLQPRKNYVRLIEAFAQVKTFKLADPQLLIAGGRGWLYEDIFAEAAKYGDLVRILGFVDDADLPSLYRSAALFVFPSLYEGFGFPVLEAMACGVPTISSNASSLPEVAGDAALLVDPLSVGALVEAMTGVLENAALSAGMISRGLVQAARFTWERGARQLVKTFERLL
jgi:glycosyltransferase involved in cell wall biosynthesis